MKEKKELFRLCENFVNKRLQTIEEIISSNQKALQTETKSSAGDKHETGRAMMQLEMEKAGQQLAAIHVMKQNLAKIDIHKTSEKACLGSIVLTNQANYFLAISVGKLTVFNKLYFAISTSSPIGKLLLGKAQGEELQFNSNTIQVKKII